jgi:hypothetical protein
MFITTYTELKDSQAALIIIKSEACLKAVHISKMIPVAF